jgi:hypothetical protein
MGDDDGIVRIIGPLRLHQRQAKIKGWKGFLLSEPGQTGAVGEAGKESVMSTGAMGRKVTVSLLGMALPLWLAVVPGWAGFEEGVRAYQSGDYATALRAWLPLAEQGHATAQFNLGVLYERGRGVPQDYALAVQWYRQAAEQGHATAQFNLGVLYGQGHGVPPDHLQAYLWFMLAADGLPPGTDREKAERNRDVAAARLPPAQLAEARALAQTWASTPEAPIPGAPGLQAPPRALSPQASPRHGLVRQVQERLQAAGFNPGAIDGAMGRQTRDALRWFQNTKGLLATGEPDEKTLEALGVR